MDTAQIISGNLIRELRQQTFNRSAGPLAGDAYLRLAAFVSSTFHPGLTAVVCAQSVHELDRLRRRTLAQRSDPIFKADYTFSFGAVTAAEDRSVALKAVANDARATVSASWSERADCTFETVEHVLLAMHQDFERLVVVVPAGFANWHYEYLV